ncbi:MAG TPA: helix-turn-helix domain-containing protein [bacterium]|jgi:excisionase family DNA binding protein|nr:helix-turn-helix domain-containing protein [bacterium]
MAVTADRHWIALGEASRLLGVNASTLRLWADAGRVKTFRTPGGHRRFVRTDLEGLLQRGRAPRPPQIARLIQRESIALARRRPFEGEGWYAALGERGRERVRRTCRALMAALMGYLSQGPRASAYLREGENAGRALGAALAPLRLRPAEAARAFLYFREMTTRAVTTRLSLPLPEQVRALRQIDHFLNEVMLQMMEVFERTER